MNAPLALVIEDEADLAEIFEKALTAAGYEVETIRDGSLARERIRQVKPAMITLDMHLPHISGDKLLDQIRADERLDKTRVVVTTADAQMAERMRGHADLILVKPITFTQLRDLTARLIPRES